MSMVWNTDVNHDVAFIITAVEVNIYSHYLKILHFAVNGLPVWVEQGVGRASQGAVETGRTTAANGHKLIV